MKIVFVADQPYFPQLYGGIQTSTDELCRVLIARGHQVALLMRLMPGGLFGWIARIKMQINRRLCGCKIARDTARGYPVWRTWFPAAAMAYIAKRENPDLIVVMSGKMIPLIQAAKRTGIAVMVQLHDVAFHAQDGRLEELIGIPCVANSNFTAEKYRDTYGIKSTTIYPFIAPEKYRTQSTRENVTFVNPHPRKGLDIALKIATACPEIPFTFVESWQLSPTQRAELALRMVNLPNVTFLPAQDDMRPIYGKCKILLAPSLREEEFGRVAAEAQLSGIPVIASARGGLPEAVGLGGLLLDPEGPIENWIEVIRKLWRDNEYYAELSDAARTHAAQPELDPVFQADAHEKALLSACRRST